MLLLFLILVAMIAYLTYRKYSRKTTAAAQVTARTEPFDHRNESRRLLENARSLFCQGQEKDAYGEVGRAMRLYLCWNNGLDKEKTCDEIISFLAGKRKSHEDIKECLDQCSLVEFAKSIPSEEDFERIVKIAEKTICQ